MRGFQVTIGGTYVLLDDVVTTLRLYADSLPDPTQVYEAAAWLVSGQQPPAVEQWDTPPPEPEIYSEPDAAVDRIEVYPEDPTAERPRWIARGCSSEGDILYVTRGSFDQDYVIRDAEGRWPGRTVHLVADSAHDTVWEERDPGGIRSTGTKRRRPSPKRLWA
jgi:hypothetical protein